MKKVNYQIKVLLVLLIGIMPMMLNQNTATAQSTTADPHLYIQGFGGITQLYGDINPDMFWSTKPLLGYGFNLGYQFHPVFGIRGAFSNGKYQSEKEGLLATSSLWDGQLHLTANLSNLFGGARDRGVSFYGFAGVGYNSYSSMLERLSPNRAIVDRNGAYYNTYPVEQTPDPDVYHDIVLPTGLGLAFRLGERADLNLEVNHRLTFKDRLDLWENNKNDTYATIMAGLTFKFGSGAGLRNMEKNYGDVKYEVNPNPLVANGDTVCANVRITFPPKYFGKKAAMVWQPELRYGGQVKKLKPVNFQGENVQGNGIVVSYENGGTYNYTDCFPYDPAMNVSELWVCPVLYAPNEPVSLTDTPEAIKAKYNTVDIACHKLADGVINTGALVSRNENLLQSGDEYGKYLGPAKSATYYFAVNRWNRNDRLPLNVQRNAVAQLNEMEQYIREGNEVNYFDLNAWASPEGEVGYNQMLSENRAKTGRQIVVDMLNKITKDANSTVKFERPLETVRFNMYANGEDWDGFRAAVEASNISDKGTILNIVDSQRDVVAREQQIRNLTSTYREIREDILPPLRRVEINLFSGSSRLSDAELLELYNADPAKLDNEGLIHAAGYMPLENYDARMAAYRLAMERYPNDWRAYNNAAIVEMQRGNYNEAATLLSRADALSANNSVIVSNQAALALKRGDYVTAAQLNARAKSLGADVSYNEGLYYLADGKYDRAIQLMGAKTCDPNLGLAYLMTGRYSEANSQFTCAPETAQNYYLRAVVGARTNDAAMLTSNLQKAIEMDATYKAKAAIDREFLNYYTNTDFMNLVR